jgi:hypothetical protein
MIDQVDGQANEERAAKCLEDIKAKAFAEAIRQFHFDSHYKGTYLRKTKSFVGLQRTKAANKQKKASRPSLNRRDCCERIGHGTPPSNLANSDKIKIVDIFEKLSYIYQRFSPRHFGLNLSFGTPSVSIEFPL